MFPQGVAVMFGRWIFARSRFCAVGVALLRSMWEVFGRSESCPPPILSRLGWLCVSRRDTVQVSRQGQFPFLSWRPAPMPGSRLEGRPQRIPQRDAFHNGMRPAMEKTDAVESFDIDGQESPQN